MPLGTSIPAQTPDNQAKVIHRFAGVFPKLPKSEQSRDMNHFRRIKLYSGFGLALAMALTWQQASDAKAEIPEPWQAVLDAPIHLVNPYRQPNSDYSAGHRGVDYEVSLGQPIDSPVNAEVRFNQVLVDRPVLSLGTEAGDLIEFEPACSSLKVGSQVKAGDAIGYVCAPLANYRTHCQAQTCLHFSLRTELGYLSPMVRYGALAPSVLLPHL
jgi:murein DD-endopeptidase MepM/ murein hydrolase activator NlpD